MSLNQIGRSILSELTVRDGRQAVVYIETASLTLAARLFQKHCG